MGAELLENLWGSCGGSGELRLVVGQGPRQTTGVVFQSPFVVIGRGASCDLVLKDPQVSRCHIYLQVIGGRIWCTDLKSRTGTYWGAQKAVAGWFDPIENIRIGPYQLQLYPGDNLADRVNHVVPTQSIPAQEDPWPGFELDVVDSVDPGAPISWRLDRTLTFIGQSQYCKIRSVSPGLGKFHCSLLRTSNGVWAIDLLGPGGISVNGERVRYAQLKPGDHLQVGRFKIVPRATGSGPEPTARAKRASDLRQESGGESSMSGLDLGSTPGGGALTQMVAKTPSPPSPPVVPWTNLETQNQLTNAALEGLPPVFMAYLNQFGMMHQQMMEQFQQSTLMMMQMFGQLQREQFEMVRQELEAIRMLNKEMQILQAELTKQQSAPVENMQANRKSDPAPVSPALATPSKNGVKGAFDGGFPRLDESQLPPGLAQTPPRPAKESNEPKPVPKAPAVNGQEASAANPSEPPTEVSAGDLIKDMAGKDVHAMLSQRMNELQQQRQTRWQRLLSTFLGK